MFASSSSDNNRGQIKSRDLKREISEENQKEVSKASKTERAKLIKRDIIFP